MAFVLLFVISFFSRIGRARLHDCGILWVFSLIFLKKWLPDVWVSVSTMSFILRGWCAIGLRFLEIRREAVFVYRLKSINHEAVHLFSISKSIVRVPAADWVYNNNVQAGVFSKKADGSNYIMYIIIQWYPLGDTGKNENPIYLFLLTQSLLHTHTHTHARTHARMHVHIYIHILFSLNLLHIYNIHISYVIWWKFQGLQSY